MEINLIKNLNLTLFKISGGSKKIEVAGGKQSEGVLALSSLLEPKAVGVVRNSVPKQSRQAKQTTRRRKLLPLASEAHKLGLPHQG
jgi:hypothetical protein